MGILETEFRAKRAHHGRPLVWHESFCETEQAIYRDRKWSAAARAARVTWGGHRVRAGVEMKKVC